VKNVEKGDFSRPRFSKNGRSCLGLFTLFHALFTLFHGKNRFLSVKNRFFNLFTLSEMDQTDAEKRALFAPAHKKGGHELGSIPKHPSANVSRLKSTSKTL